MANYKRQKNIGKKKEFIRINSLSLDDFVEHLNSFRVNINDIDKSYYDLCKFWNKTEWNGEKFVIKNK